MPGQEYGGYRVGYAGIVESSLSLTDSGVASQSFTTQQFHILSDAAAASEALLSSISVTVVLTDSGAAVDAVTTYVSLHVFCLLSDRGHARDCRVVHGAGSRPALGITPRLEIGTTHRLDEYQRLQLAGIC